MKRHRYSDSRSSCRPVGAVIVDVADIVDLERTAFGQAAANVVVVGAVGAVGFGASVRSAVVVVAVLRVVVEEREVVGDAVRGQVVFQAP